MKMILVTKEAPTFAMKGQVADILKQSQCVNESLTNTYGDAYLGMDEEHIYIGAREGVETVIEY